MSFLIVVLNLDEVEKWRRVNVLVEVRSVGFVNGFYESKEKIPKRDIYLKNWLHHF